ncbi:MAG: S-methyl-5-thioribose-1-phosphate isomerase [Candidatus Hydrogenedentes bacterium]|nr:S-methyl-5-thioribose-1-phosphate isomerase [Candidatus Hydrogenedentota bacterium]
MGNVLGCFSSGHYSGWACAQHYWHGAFGRGWHFYSNFCSIGSQLKKPKPEGAKDECVHVASLKWSEGELTIIDQTRLPGETVLLALRTLESVWQAIKRLQVRGAPAIGVCAAFGIIVSLREERPATVGEALSVVETAAAHLATSRPTAVNLFWSLDRMQACARSLASGCADAEAFLATLEAEAIAIWEEDRALCKAIGDAGAELVPAGGGVLTHCNAGALATSAYGTALAVLFRAQELGRNPHVFADETRPLLQGARLTAWELQQAGVPVTLICDNAAAQVMREGKVQMVIVGADRIAANGDTANKIGTYGVALLAAAHGIPFYVAAPSSTFDLSLQTGEEIPIEQRDEAEVTEGFGVRTAPQDIQVYNPAFDVTPARYIAGIVTEKGVLRPPYAVSIRAAFGAAEVGLAHV